MENFNEDYLQHHGTKGMRWGVRRYQNKDGSLTPAGKKHYNKEAEKLKVESQKLKAQQKVLENKKKTQAKFEKLDEKKAQLEAEKKALKDAEKKFKKGEKEVDDKPKETVEEKRARLLKSSDASELYKNKDLLTTAEINERLDRINTEQRLANVAVSTKTTGMQKVEKAVDTFKRVDKAVSTVTDSAIGKKLAKKLGIGDKESSGFDLDKAYKNLNKMSNKEAQDTANRVENNRKIKEAWEKAHDNDSKKDDSKKDQDTKKKDDNSDAKKDQDSKGNKDTSNNKKTEEPKTERYEATADDIVGEGTSRSKYNDSSNDTSRKSADYYDPIDADGRWVNDTPVSNVPAVRRDAGESYVAGLLDVALNSEAARAGRLLLEEAIK